MPTRPPVHRPVGSRRAKLEQQQQYNRSRQWQGLYDHAWRRYSRQRLLAHPWCVACIAEGLPRNLFSRAQVTDHIRPHRGDPVLFRDPTNHQSLCKTHHDSKTRQEQSTRDK